ncbi:hypothetical protein D4768_09775 [Rhodococcus erythropolis]|uniref:hypothetical protein n=1 Tax=Rhodococcus erythropolis TaxID=1833 RepID=UPI001F47B658|nr:hypothetical protein [Rhodococcus erythropolis]UJC77956.1 hypothetical protein D4768_09775 [Rhodococcus erythropolis]
MTTDCHNCGRTVADDFDLCHDCMATLVKNLESVPGLVSDILITRSRQDRMSSNLARGKSAETALPIRLDQYDQRPTQRPFDALTNELVTWARDLDALIGGELDAALDSRGLRDIVHRHRHSRRPDPASLSQDGALDAELAAIWLSLYANDLRRHPAVAELFDGIEDAIARCRKAIDRLPELSYKGPCPHVGYDEERQPFTCSADLYVERGEDYVSCPRCWTHHRVRDLEREIMDKMGEQLFTAADIERLTREMFEGEFIPAATVRQWRHREIIEPRAWKQADGTMSRYWIRRSDPPMYRLQDVLDARTRGES